MPKSSKEIQSQLKKGVQDAVAARSKTRQRPKLAHLSKLPGDGAALLALQSMVRQGKEHLGRMAAGTAKVHAQIVLDKTEEFKRWGKVEGEKPNHWIDEVGEDRRIVARNRAIDKAKAAHAAASEGPRTDIIGALRSVRGDLNATDPLFHSQVSMLLRVTLGDGKRAQYARVLEHAGVIAINSAVLDCINGVGNRALGAALVTILEENEQLASRCNFTREDIADVLMHDEYWDARQAIGLTRYHIEQAEVSVLELEGKKVSTERKLKAGLMRSELEAAIGKSFSEDGDELDPEGEIVEPVKSSPSGNEHDDFYNKLAAESAARDAVVVAAKRKKEAAARKEREDDVTRIGNMNEDAENRKYGGDAYADSVKAQS